jgi:hypothetical protein
MVGVTGRHSRLWCGSADMVYILVDGGWWIFCMDGVGFVYMAGISILYL